MAKSKEKSKGKVKTAAEVSKPKGIRKDAEVFLLGRKNYMIMAGGLVLILIGFALMAGGGFEDKATFPQEEIYSFRRITLAPIIVMLGFAIEVYAIMMKPGQSE